MPDPAHQPTPPGERPRPLDHQLSELSRLEAPLFASSVGPVHRNLPRKVINLWHRTVNRKQVAFNRQIVSLLAGVGLGDLRLGPSRPATSCRG